MATGYLTLLRSNFHFPKSNKVCGIKYFNTGVKEPPVEGAGINVNRAGFSQPPVFTTHFLSQICFSIWMIYIFLLFYLCPELVCWACRWALGQISSWSVNLFNTNAARWRERVSQGRHCLCVTLFKTSLFVFFCFWFFYRGLNSTRQTEIAKLVMFRPLSPLP